ncbi:peptidylprolyl isomerase [Oceanobacillus sp. CFH 90083]|uniref:peptidylprolyl isomerase n=1 Tax=Oceanobacillus sp. CFH 90083 TaxID=2592336 RepID=UPI00128B22D8|nr:peptidylprolyl isomerase [Oceanobacillus sp. CFH 90083]
MFKIKTYLFIAVIFMAVLTLIGCGVQSDENETENEQETESSDQTGEEVTATFPDIEENPVVTITMENKEEIIMELYPEIAPNTVANFISLIEDGFYDGVIFHRVIPGFMIQGGDPEGTGAGGPGYSIAGEFSSNGFENDLEHERGILSMARTNAPDSAGSQFFIMVEHSPHLDGDYAAFGKVIEGMEVADAIVAAEQDAQDKPLEDQIIETMTVDTKGYEFPEPEIQ